MKKLLKILSVILIFSLLMVGCSSKEVSEPKETNTQENENTSGVLNAEDIKVGDNIEGFSVREINQGTLTSEIENGLKGFKLDLEGEITLEGTLMYFPSLEVYGMDIKEDSMTDTKIKLKNDGVIDLFYENSLSFRNSEIIEEKLGEELSKSLKDSYTFQGDDGFNVSMKLVIKDPNIMVEPYTITDNAEISEILEFVVNEKEQEVK